MKNSIKSILFILGSLFLLSSCGDFLEDVDVKGDDEIAVVGFISPDDSLVQIALFRAIGIGSGKEANQTDYIQNAIVRISDGQNSYVMNYGTNPYGFEDLGNGYFNYSFDKPQFTYQLENSVLNISEGKTYSIEIETDKGEKLSASCTVPVGKVIPSIILEEKAKGYNDGYSYEVEWNDNSNEINYYRLEAYKVSSDLTYDYDTERPQPNGINTEIRSLDFEDNYFQTLDGRSTIRYKSEGTIYLDDTSNPNFPNYIVPKPYIMTHLIKSDENYYRYHKSVTEAYNNEGNPFGEPIIIHSNIKNGIGCFGAYITAKVRTEAE